MRQGIIAGVLIFLLSITAGVLYWQLRKAQKQKTALETEKIDLETNLQTLDQRIRALEQELERKDIELTEKTRKLEELDKELKKAQAQIHRYQEEGRISARQAEEMRYKTEQMAYYIQKYQERIRQLEEENEQLRARATELEKKVREKESETQQVLQEKERLEVKVKAASFLKAINFRFAAVKENGKEDWDTEFKPRRLQRFKICFTVLENEVAEPGDRTAYIVISDPTGKVITNFAKSSGYFTLMDTEQPFSTKAAFHYTKSAQEVCAIFEKSEDQELSKGTYQAVVFCEGVEIGRGQFQVK
ncbi:MAG: hypothetical protein N2253_06580 [Bacteroidia bacterium]|nr:hypothetical protein [Bacteroidia bacterium]MCX7764538.1 hypothetical protein [Bacteroidia bacterium]MDW8057833.1 hypothetical protein [Bacteroidia bacterium]